jgi:hypothetical protein
MVEVNSTLILQASRDGVVNLFCGCLSLKGRFLRIIRRPVDGISGIDIVAVQYLASQHQGKPGGRCFLVDMFENNRPEAIK